jgi:hypothetical protein
MGRQKLPAPGNKAVKDALDVARVRFSDIGEWLAGVTHEKRAVAAGTLNNYRNGRREMPAPMRRLLAAQLRKHARRVEEIADQLEQIPEGRGRSGAK